MAEKYLGSGSAAPTIVYYTNLKYEEDPSFGPIIRVGNGFPRSGTQILITRRGTGRDLVRVSVTKTGATGGGTIKIGVPAPLLAPNSVSGSAPCYYLARHMPPSLAIDTRTEGTTTPVPRSALYSAWSSPVIKRRATPKGRPSNSLRWN